MYRFGLWLLALAFLLSVAAGPAAAPASAASVGAAAASACEWQTGTGGIQGRVTLPGGTPEANARMSLYTTDGRYSLYSFANQAGDYRFSGLPAGSYLLQATSYSPQGYAPEWFDGQDDPEHATAISVTDGYTATANVELAPGARISGQVFDSGGVPLGDAPVAVVDGKGTHLANTRTDATGVYTTTPGLVPGQYRVRFSAPSGQPYLDEYYADQADFDSATVINVTAREPVGYVNATLERGARIRGIVTNALTGDPVQAEIYVSGPAGSAYVRTNSNGYYQTGGLVSGVYTVRFTLTDNALNLYGTTQVVTITAPYESTVDGTLLPGAQITGRITDASGDPISGAYASAYRDNDGYGRWATTNGSGVYTITGLAPGAYSVAFHRDGYGYEYYDDQTDYGQADLVTVTAANTTTGIDAVLEEAGTITGTVTAADTGLPLRGVYVRVRDPNRNQVAYTSTDGDGQYEITDLPSGQLRLEFLPNGHEAACAYQPEWHNDQARFETAEPVSVTAGQVTPNVNAVLDRGSLIAGQVVHAATAAPLDNVSVKVYDASGDEVAEGYTNFLGYYMTSPPLPSGEYRVQFTDWEGGYVDEYYADALTMSAAQPLALTAPNDVLGINAALEKGGLISGRVTAWDAGGGLPGVEVTVYADTGEPVAYAWTDAEGRYTVEAGLATGSYRIGFDAYPEYDPETDDLALAGDGFLLGPTSSGQTASPEIAGEPVEAALDPTAPLNLPFGLDVPRGLLGGIAPPASNMGYLPMFYHNKLSLAQADLVVVTAPNETTGVDAIFLNGTFLPVIQR